MKITNVITYDGMTQADYFALPGMSYSGIKNEGVKIETTEKMRLGLAVDSYLFEPSEYDGYMFHVVRPLAHRVKSYVGDTLLKQAKRQLVVTCLMHYNGFVMPYKGRIDLFPTYVIDLKVSKLNLLKAIQHFGYDRQLSGYAMPMRCQKSLIISIHPDTKIISSLPIPTQPEWWRDQVLKYGVAA